MEGKNQKNAFIEYEANEWFFRNKDLNYKPENDTIVTILEEYKCQPQNVLEIGSSYGYRLDAIAKKFQTKSVTGVEPSSAAVNYGRLQFPNVKFLEGTADDLSTLSNEQFDLVIIGFVLYVVDRELLFKVVAETDRVLKNGGILMLIDFFSEKPTRNPYQHIQDREAFAYKQNYEEIFLASQLYHLLDKRSMNHLSKGYDISGDYYNKYSMTTLRKDLSAGYK